MTNRRPYERIFVLTGAGISAESGIRTFRAADGLWEDHNISDVATPEAFVRDPEFVHQFYNSRRAQHEGTDGDQGPVKPNAGHVALARFEETFAGRFLLVTQNVDALHERAGSKNLLHMHGELLKMRCSQTGDVFDFLGPCDVSTLCSCCSEPGLLRPHIVWFGEMPFHMTQIERELRSCDLFVSIGTSGNVYPAAGFFQIAKANGAHTVELNLEPSQNARTFSERHYGPGTSIIPLFFKNLLEKSR